MTSAHRIPRQEYWETSREANIKEQKGSDKEKENWISRKTHIERPPSPNSVPLPPRHRSANRPKPKQHNMLATPRINK